MSDSETLILFEGNIAAGKSTVGRRLRASGLFGFVEEPVNAWQEGFASNLLELFYQDPKRWSFTFQLAAFTTRAMTWSKLLKEIEDQAVVLERSIYCDRYVFAKNCYHRGLMTDTEWQLYCCLWDWLEDAVWAEPDVIVYLRTPAHVCLKRIRERGREEETSLTLSYLRDLEALHDEWLLDNPDAIVLDGQREWTAEGIRDVLLDHGMKPVTKRAQEAH